MNLLDKIAKTKRSEVMRKQATAPVSLLEKSYFFNQSFPSLNDALAGEGPSIIGEFKRRSPSRGAINLSAEIEKVAADYQAAGVAAISVLTDEEYFGGSNADLEKARGIINIPILRKDFIVDEYQIIEAKSIGASAILLIAAILTKEEVTRFAGLALELNLDILFEIHDKEDLEKFCQEINIIGINNRNLRSFKLNLRNSDELLKYLPGNCLKVAESGISSPEDVVRLYESGFDAFLIGEKFMKHANPGSEAMIFINSISSAIR